MELVNLHDLMEATQRDFPSGLFESEHILPDAFKEAVSDFDGTQLMYLKYTSVLLERTPGLNIVFPNQWFYIAAYMTDYYHMLLAYKQKIFEVLRLDNAEMAKNTLRGVVGNEDMANTLFDNAEYHDVDREWLIKFITDYSWWRGGKTIDRADFYVSPVLALAHLVNASQSFVADICKFLAEHTSALNALKTEIANERLKGVKFPEDPKVELSEAIKDSGKSTTELASYLRAMRTKPFLLLAGISGTGKSRLVKQMAFDSCPDNAALRKDPTSSGNYCLIEVKPNWHDSTELLGYESKIGGAHYHLTPFVKFLAKAMMHSNVPFFVCLDEMNLAPVEQYFAEFLSVLESRTKINGHIVSEPLIKAGIFCKYEHDMKRSLFSHEEVATTGSYGEGLLTDEPALGYGKEYEVYSKLKEEGLRIPENVIVVGTVNMDETTHQFSRKVIDRAMTIEMNLPEGEPFKDFFENRTELAYREVPVSPSLYLATETKASDVVRTLADDNAEKTETLKEQVATFLVNLNSALDGTPFKVAYRVQNELMLYFYQIWLEDKTAEWDAIQNTAADQILMMKVLPRIEGDEELLEKPLEKLITFCEPYANAQKKLTEMKARLGQSRFTSFWP